MRGFFNFLLENSQESRQFLDNFVCVIVPMLNPDGVYRGHYRLDALGFDLNRMYKNCFNNKEYFSSIYAIF